MSLNNDACNAAKLEGTFFANPSHVTFVRANRSQNYIPSSSPSLSLVVLKDLALSGELYKLLGCNKI